MSDKQSERTIMMLVLPSSETEAQATITVKQGDLGHLSVFDYADFGDLCRGLNKALAAFVGVLADPPKAIKPAKTAGKKKTKKTVSKPKPAGKPPYHLLDASGKRRKMTMMDPFDLQEKYQKDNAKLSFDVLDEALDAATQLVDAGDKQITVAYSNGKPVKVLPEAESDTNSNPQADLVDNPTDVEPIIDVNTAINTKAADDDAKTVQNDGPANDNEADTELTVTGESETDVITKPSYPDAINSDAKRAFYDLLHDEHLTLDIFNDIQTLRQPGWKAHLIKQRQVKGLIVAYLDGKDELIEQVYQIAHESVEFDDAETEPSHSQ